MVLFACASAWPGLAHAQPFPRDRRPAPAADAPATTTPAPAAEPLRTAIDRPIDVKNIRLDLAVDLPKKSVEGTATLSIRSLRPVKLLDLDAVDFKVKKVTLTCEGQEPREAKFNHDGKKLTVLLDAPWPAGQEATLKVDYKVQEPKSGLHFFGPTSADREQPLCVWSQGEPVGNRHWIPCVDEPDQRQTTELVVTAPEGFEVVSNGKLIDKKENPSAKTVTFDWKQDKAHPSYLITMVVGQFDVVCEEWDGVPVLYYVPKGQKDQVTYTFGRTRDMLGYFSKRFGIHYPWDKYAQIVAYRFGGGMENTSATTLGEIMHDERSMLDRTADSLISHELAHQWWGDLVTCRDWAHIWLNEGFASFAECLWDEHKDGADAYAYNLVQKSRAAMNGGKTRPVVDRRYPNPDSMFDSRAYPKGAWLLHMLRRRVGEDAFWRAIQKYGTEHRLQSAETADYRRTLERESGRNLERFFYDWTERPGHPVLEVTTEYLPASQQARVVIKQTQSGEPFHFPLTVLLHSAGSAKPVAVQQDVTDKEYTVLVPLPGPLTLVEVDPEQTILAEIKETKSRDLWAAQLTNGSTVPVRIRAAQHFKDSKTDEDRELLAGALAKEPFWGVQSEIAADLASQGGDKARDALLQGAKHANAKVRRSCIDHLGSFKEDPVIADAMKQILANGDPSYAVCGAAMATYAKQKGKDAFALLSPYLSKPSHNDVFKSSALTALGNSGDLSALDTLLNSAKVGNPRRVRSAALQGVIQLARKAKPNDDQRKQIQGGLTAALEGDDPLGHFAVLNALPELGSLGTALLPQVEKLSRDAASERERTMATRTAERIKSEGKPATPSASDEVKQLREEIERLKRDQAELREKLKKFEKSEGK
jgi:aminopeptidase N